MHLVGGNRLIGMYLAAALRECWLRRRLCGLSYVKMFLEVAVTEHLLDIGTRTPLKLSNRLRRLSSRHVLVGCLGQWCLETVGEFRTYA